MSETKKDLLTAKEIMDIIPHRQPFMLIDAIERAGTDDSELIRQEMYNTKDFEGASGVININENGDAEKSCVIQGFVNGEKQIITIVEP